MRANCIHPSGFCQITAPCENKCALLTGGVAFIMGPGGDEGTRQCFCGQYPHTAECVAPSPNWNAR